MTRWGGFTLAEAVIGSFLAALLLTLLLAILVPALRLGARTYLRLEKSQLAARVVRQLQADLGRTALPGVSLSPLVIQPLRGLAGASSAWESRWVVYHHDSAERTLRRLEHDPALDDVRRPHLPSPAELATALQGLPGARTLAREVEEFRLSVPPELAGRGLVRLELKLEGQEALGAAFHVRSPGL